MSTENKELEIMYPEGKPVTIGSREFKIKPFVLKNRISFIRLFAEVSVEAAKDPSFRNLNDVGVIVAIIDKAGMRLVDVYVELLGAEREWLMENVQLKHEIAIVQAIMEMNDIPLLISQIQQMMRVKKQS